MFWIASILEALVFWLAGVQSVDPDPLDCDDAIGHEEEF